VEKLDLLEFFRELKEQRKAVVSVCTANWFVLDSVMKFQKEKDTLVIIESTSNQVNHRGGYSGLTPFDFRKKVLSLAEKNGVQTQKLIIGADHAGPWPWVSLSANEAMEEAKKLVSACVRAGYKKIHIDTSYKLANDVIYDKSIVARRQAELCYVAEQAHKDVSHEDPVRPVYVLGTDVPPPGGSLGAGSKHTFTAEELLEDLDITRREFLKLGLKDAWGRVVAYVVNTGADFTSFDVTPYESDKFGQLRSLLLAEPFVFEAHSTDYQRLETLVRMVNDGFGVLKVGPELTFRFREAVFALCDIEEETIEPQDRSHLVETILSQMRVNPKYWKNYYRGDEVELKFSLYDRIRYYWSDETVQTALKKLLTNLCGLRVPASLIHQHLPDVVEDISGTVVIDPFKLIESKIRLSLEKYYRACENA